MSGPLAAQPHVLLAEDDADLRDMLAFLLREEGYLVTPVASLAQAMALLEQDTFQFILSDLFREAASDPLASLELLRERAWPIPVGIMTAWEMSEDVIKQRGFSCLIHKPFDLDLLSETIAACLNTPLSPKQVSQVRIIERFYSALSRRDGDAAVSLCAEDFTYLPIALRINPALAQVRGRATYRAFLEEVFGFYHQLQTEIGSIAAHPRGLAIHQVGRWKDADGNPLQRTSSMIVAFAGDQIARLEQRTAAQPPPTFAG